MQYTEYLASTAVDSDELLSEWRWLTGPDLQLWHVTKAGDAFLRDQSNGAIYFLDIMNGNVERIAPSESSFEEAVTVPENAERWLMPAIVDGQAVLGMKPGTNQCLSFKHPPVLGGQLDPDNFETCDVLVHFSIAGQIHRQVKDLPAGTKIENIKIEDRPRANRRPRWRFW